jgi:hypothetical protein
VDVSPFGLNASFDFGSVSELFDAVEDELETSFELARVVIARCPKLFDHFDVDLPAPFGPRKPVTSPSRTSKLSPSTATVDP